MDEDGEYWEPHCLTCGLRYPNLGHDCDDGDGIDTDGDHSNCPQDSTNGAL